MGTAVRRLVAVTAIVMMAAFSFQNCGKFAVTDAASISVPFPINYNQSVVGNPISILASVASSFGAIDPTFRSGTIDPSCLANSAHDVCLFWKNPAATAQERGSPLFDPPANDTLSDLELQQNQLFGVSLQPYVTTGKLQNNFFDIYYSDTGGLAQRITLPNNRWNRSFMQGHDPASPFAERFSIEQIQSYYYLNRFRDTMATDGGRYYPTGTLAVNVVTVDAGFNVFFDPVTNGIYAGVRGGQMGRYYPLALNSELLVREAARSNFLAANSKMTQASPTAVYVLGCRPGTAKPYFTTDSNNLTKNEGEVLKAMQKTCGHTQVTSPTAVPFCADGTGCWKAIENGQADFFAYIMYAKWPSIGELGLLPEDVRYWKKRSNVSRSNTGPLLGFSYYDDFSRKNVSVAGDASKMGELFADILFEIYADSFTERPSFIRTVNDFLPQITAATTFIEAKQILTAVDLANYNGRNGGRIKFHFEQRGY